MILLFSGLDGMKAVVDKIFVPAIQMLDSVNITDTVSAWDVIIGFSFIAICATVLWRFGGAVFSGHVGKDDKK